MSLFVLVHGAWGSTSDWQRLVPELAKLGQQTASPALTGLGDLAHLATPAVTLGTHIADVVDYIDVHDLQGVVLVGHSYAGMVIAGVADRLPQRVAQLVFVDAFVPEDGQAVFTINEPGGTYPPPQPLTAADDWRMPGEPGEPPMPKGCFLEPVSLTTPLAQRSFGLTYIKATGTPRPADGPPGFWPFADRARSDARWRYLEIACGHEIARERPAELARLLTEA